MKWRCVKEGAWWTEGKVYEEVFKPNHFGDISYMRDDSGTKRRNPRYYNNCPHLPDECKFINVSFDIYLKAIEDALL